MGGTTLKAIMVNNKRNIFEKSIPGTQLAILGIIKRLHKIINHKWITHFMGTATIIYVYIVVLLMHFQLSAGRHQIRSEHSIIAPTFGHCFFACAVKDASGWVGCLYAKQFYTPTWVEDGTWRAYTCTLSGPFIYSSIDMQVWVGNLLELLRSCIN